MLVPFSRRAAIAFLLILIPLTWLAYAIAGWQGVSLLGFVVAGWLLVVSCTWLFASIYGRADEEDVQEEESHS